MIILFILGTAAALFIAASRFYGPLLANVFGERADRPTPAVALEDGQDYVPTNTGVVFAHHFASIAGAGPIVGPIIGLIFGWVPALLWVLFGAVFAGAVHDFGAMYVSVRERGKSIAVIARQTLGKAVYLMFVFLLIVLMLLVVAMFLILSAKALTSQVPALALGLPATGEGSWIDVANGQAKIGGIASTSVIILTLFAPLMGWLYLKRKVSVLVCSALAVGLCSISIYLGILFPVRIAEVPMLADLFGVPLDETPQVAWMLGLSVYCLLAAGLPVWIFLQSRDFINVHILYIGIAGLLVGLLLAGFWQLIGLAPAPQFEAFHGFAAETNFRGGLSTVVLWPFLFITIACGACSGFHSLCATGTTAKQLRNEPAARHVGFNAMLLEGFLATCVIAAVMVGVSTQDYGAIMLPAEGKANPVLLFALAVGGTMNQGFGLPVAAGAIFGMLLLEGFLVTTLDTAIRLSRFLFQEVWSTLFANYDVFADKAKAEEEAVAASCCGLETPELHPAGAAGLPDHLEHAPSADPADKPREIIKTTGGLRLGLQIIEHYWFNTALIIVLMLIMALQGYVTALWALFGAGNQLLAALSLLVVSSWLLSHGRTVWYTFLPACFMLVTTVTMLVNLLFLFSDSPPLLIFDIIILSLTSGMFINAGIRYARTSITPKAETVTVDASEPLSPNYYNPPSQQ